jgi:NAD(P)-dependent dehydrogenase (short-subunit alcohol dehydrogenase family)
MPTLPKIVSVQDVVLVTGGSRGIGAAIVRGAIRRGYNVCFSFLRDHAAALSLVRELDAGKGRIHYIQGDVADPAFARAFFEEAERALGPVTALVNNAGITGRIGPLRDLPLDVLRRTVETNLIGPTMLAQEAVRRWEARRTPGRMVNISSAGATLGSPHEYVHYAATKAAIEALTIGLGKEVAALGIRVNAVSPGTTYTEIHAAGGDADRPARVVSRVPLNRIAAPDEIAAAVLWLLSAEASYVTATVLRVSGGA